MSLFVDTLKGRRGPRSPIWLMRQAGRYLPEYREIRARAPNFLEFCYSPALATEVTLQPLRRFPLDAAILFSDILVIPDALGRRVRFLEGEGPQLDPLTGGADVAALEEDRVLTRLAPVFETVERVRSALPGDKALIGFAGSPWTVATYMTIGRGGSDKGEARLWAYRNPDAFEKLLAVLARATALYLCAQIKAGADAVQLFDSWADGLPAPAFDRWVIAPTRAIVDAVRAEHPDVPIIGFPRGCGGAIGRYQHETGVNAVGLDTGADPEMVNSALPAHVAVQGNLDPMLMIAGGDPLIAEADRILADYAGRPHVFNLGHGITPQADIATVDRLIRHVTGA
jgi:uroporphyrinogen decarboxylase